jgi:hypothetical protein
MGRLASISKAAVAGIRYNLLNVLAENNLTVASEEVQEGHKSLVRA